MGRLWKFSLALFLPIAVIAAAVIATNKPGPPAIVQFTTQRYTSYLFSISHQTFTIQQIVQAVRPWNFQSQMSKASFGDSVYYRTTNNYNSPRGNGPRPLPFPPVDLWCVIVQPDNQLSATVVFVAEHQDIYNADWILHEPNELEASVSDIGCDLGLPQ